MTKLGVKSYYNIYELCDLGKVSQSFWGFIFSFEEQG